MLKKLKNLIFKPGLRLNEAKIFTEKVAFYRIYGYSETEIAKMLLGNYANSSDLRKKYNKSLKLLKIYEMEE